MSAIAIIGGGASGIFAAIAAAENPSASVTIYEGQSRIGRKILATGNGRCNMTNVNASPEHYHGSDTEFIRRVLEKFPADDALAAFSRLGILYKVEDEGKVYPYSDNASAVLDVLRMELDKKGVAVKCGFEVRSVIKKNGGFLIKSYGGETAYADRVIIACGGRAAPDLGAKGGGYAILESFGHHITKLRPSLVQLKTRGDTAKKLKGIKVNALVSLGERGERGETLFTEYGLSGPTVFSLSADYAGQRYIALDIMPEYGIDELIKMLEGRRDISPEKTLDVFLVGMLNKRVAQVVLKTALGAQLSRTAGSLTAEEIRKTASLIKEWRFEIEGTMSWNNAQVTKGGAYLSEFDPETMRSRLVKGLYASGEILDADGDCGGYNLQWAWATGYIAGKNSSEGV